jgi:hypothetical protein
MADEPEALLLVYLRRIDGKVDGLGQDLQELKARVSAVELGQAAIRRDLAQLVETDARLQIGLDRLHADVGRIRRRLDLHDEPAGP